MQIAAVLLAAASVISSSALLLQHGPEVCMPMTAVVASLEHLDNEVESARLKLLTSLEKVLTEGEIESSTIQDLRRVMVDFQGEIEKCERQRVEAQLDVETYRRELQELWEIAHVGIQNHNWTALSLLGERSVTAVRKVAKSQHQQVRVSAGVKRAAEMHYGLVKHAQAVSSCQQKHASLADNGNFTEYLNISEDAEGPCLVAYRRLRAVYREAYLHISTLLLSATSISESDACFRAAYSLHEERQVSLEMRIETARKEMCQGHLAGLAAEADARKVREQLSATQRLVDTGCFSMDWSAYIANVESLVELTFSRPQCQTCCSMVGMSSESAEEASMLDDASSTIITLNADRDHDRAGQSINRHTQELQQRVSKLRARLQRALASDDDK